MAIWICLSVRSAGRCQGVARLRWGNLYPHRPFHGDDPYLQGQTQCNGLRIGGCVQRDLGAGVAGGPATAPHGQRKGQHPLVGQVRAQRAAAALVGADFTRQALGDLLGRQAAFTQLAKDFGDMGVLQRCQQRVAWPFVLTRGGLRSWPASNVQPMRRPSVSSSRGAILRARPGASASPQALSSGPRSSTSTGTRGCGAGAMSTAISTPPVREKPRILT